MLQLRPRPVYFVGDCHASIVDKVLFRDRNSGDYFLGIGKWAGTISCENILTESNALNQTVLWGLRAEGLIAPTGSVWEPAHRKSQTAEPLIVLSCGERDARGVADDLGAQCDIILPFGAREPETARAPGARIAPYEAVAAHFTGRIARLLDAALALRVWGFAQIALLGIVPPSAGEGVPAIRRKIFALFRHLLMRDAAAKGMHLADPWHVLERDGWLRGEYCLDGIHANAQATPALLEAALASAGIAAHLELVTRLRPVYYIGDSRIARFAYNVAFDSASGTGSVALPCALNAFGLGESAIDRSTLLGDVIALLQAANEINPEGTRSTVERAAPELRFFLGRAHFDDEEVLRERLEAFAHVCRHLHGLGFTSIGVSRNAVEATAPPEVAARTARLNVALGKLAGESGLTLLRAC